MAIILITTALILIGFYFFNPAKVDFYPKCPFKTITGYDCPGCGSQQAIHNLLNIEILEAIKSNLLLVLAIIFSIPFVVINIYKNPDKRILALKKLMYSNTTLLIILIIIIVFWIVRNI